MKLKLLIFLWLAAHRLLAAEYVSNPVFANFPTPITGSFYNCGSTNGYGLWNIGLPDNTAGNYRTHQVNQGGDVVVLTTMPYPTNNIDVVSPTASNVPAGATNSLIDLVGTGGTNEMMWINGGTLYQTRANLTPGNTYTLTVVTASVEHTQFVTADGTEYNRNDDPPSGVSVILRSTSGEDNFHYVAPTNSWNGMRGEALTWNAIGPKYVYSGDTFSTSVTNGVVRVRGTVTATNLWTTNTWTFTAVSSGWFLAISGDGRHRAPLLRSVSITD